jgi:hypothetical protein
MAERNKRVLGLLALCTLLLGYVNGFAILRRQQLITTRGTKQQLKQQQQQHHAITNHQEDDSKTCQQQQRLQRPIDHRVGSSRRKTFGDMIGSVLLPTLAASSVTVSSPDRAVAGPTPPVLAGDDYILKVRFFVRCFLEHFWTLTAVRELHDGNLLLGT